jgi:hypothetical protein
MTSLSRLPGFLSLVRPEPKPKAKPYIPERLLKYPHLLEILESIAPNPVEVLSSMDPNLANAYESEARYQHKRRLPPLSEASMLWLRSLA